MGDMAVRYVSNVHAKRNQSSLPFSSLLPLFVCLFGMISCLIIVFVLISTTYFLQTSERDRLSKLVEGKPIIRVLFSAGGFNPKTVGQIENYNQTYDNLPIILVEPTQELFGKSLCEVLQRLGVGSEEEGAQWKQQKEGK